MDTFFANKAAYMVLAFAAFAIAAIAVSVAYFWYKLRREEMLINLKRDLAERGMGAEEIRTVIESCPPDSTAVAEDVEAIAGTSATHTCRSC